VGLAFIATCGCGNHASRVGPHGDASLPVGPRRHYTRRAAGPDRCLLWAAHVKRTDPSALNGSLLSMELFTNLNTYHIQHRIRSWTSIASGGYWSIDRDHLVPGSNPDFRNATFFFSSLRLM
jgi:hypothetical protein